MAQRQYIVPVQRPPVERFWLRVDRRGDDECWPWLGAKTGWGYGKLLIRGKHEGAHRFSWEIANQQPVPAGLSVLHRCDTPACVNPRHLFVGTHLENVRDMWTKGRARPYGGAIVGPRDPGLCLHGHQLVHPNLALRAGKRVCRACERHASKAYKQRQLEKRRASA